MYQYNFITKVEFDSVKKLYNYIRLKQWLLSSKSYFYNKHHCLRSSFAIFAKIQLHKMPDSIIHESFYMKNYFFLNFD